MHLQSNQNLPRWYYGVFPATCNLRPALPQVNGQLQTSDPDVYAIGDIAYFPQPRYGGEATRQEHVQVRSWHANAAWVWWMADF